MTVNKPEILRVLQETYPEAKAELHFSNPYEMLHHAVRPMHG